MHWSFSFIYDFISSVHLRFPFLFLPPSLLVLAFQMANQPLAASHAYLDSYKWREAFACAQETGLDQQQISELAVTAAGG